MDSGPNRGKKNCRSLTNLSFKKNALRVDWVRIPDCLVPERREAWVVPFWSYAPPPQRGTVWTNFVSVRQGRVCRAVGFDLRIASCSVRIG